jgi:hypothetical protein
MREEQGTSPKQLKAILLGLLADSLGELRRFNRDLDIDRVDREGGRIFMRDGRVFSVELKADASARSRMSPRRRY